MAQQSASKIIRAVDIANGNGKSTIFNDRIKNGRSFKVWGWRAYDYVVATDALKAQGYDVRWVKTAESKNPYMSGGNIRLHVFG